MTKTELLAHQPVLFTPTEFFYSPEFKSQYTQGGVYTIKDNNERLAAAVETWLKDGLVSIVKTKAVQESAARVAGTGVIT